VSGTWGVENTSTTQSDSIGGYASGEYVGAHVPITLPAGGMPPPSAGYVPDPEVPLSTFDGTVDYAGTSGVTFTFNHVYGNGSPIHTAQIYTDGGLQAYAGVGNFDVGVGPIQQDVGGLPPHFQWNLSLVANAWIVVHYFYDPFPTKVCRTLPFSGCPCSNPSTMANGCANSAGTFGGALDPSGVASLSSDTLVLDGSGMTSSIALYFQGTAYVHAQIPYGDGLRCVTGTVVRLSAKINVSGISQYPEPGDAPISIRGGVAAPGARYYQVIYRDSGDFCTPSQVNVTNGLAILWAP
jgi:hypothetical protein